MDKTKEQLQLMINNSAQKEVHELSSDEFLLFSDYAFYNTRQQNFKFKGLPLLDSQKKPLDHCSFPIGTKLWVNDDGQSDISVLILEEISLADFNVRSSKYVETQEHSLTRNQEIDKYASLMEAGVEFPALIGYRSGSDVYISDGNRRMLAAKKANLPSVKIFVEHVDENGFAKNRRSFVEEAVNNDISVQKKIIDEIEHLRNGKPIRIVFGYAEKRKNEYPAIGDQLDAIYKAINGNQSELISFWSKINAIKAKYPKPSSE